METVLREVSTRFTEFYVRKEENNDNDNDRK